MAEFHSIVEGRMQSRGRDAFGSGQPGASRGHRSHMGIDVIAFPMQKILSPIGGEVIREAFPYKDDPSMRGVLIRGNGDYTGWEIKLFYVLGLFSGEVRPGDLIGHAQNLASKYPGITNHVHMEVLRSSIKVDPREPFRQCF
ncbi:hypothetical protein [Bradyrhizobium sp. JYMT SZCCT0428]|uniref:hypothetical protein n=1 Tax=Bradyrhizobium sp. JYMT SZCCT0428 TaxID=2807673 RepID=UPI001BA4FF39|nr:hypothetical protein [Bradyrhizobium sp. JYMT SZCCT0428]MBR1157209.1 hypothetical protein [Bradyrhizobium sp. JYMT SZCCT0428]